MEPSEKAYEKVVNYIRTEIWRGNLKRGERLPPERDLASVLGVSRNSVREAIRTLGLMGFISSVHGAGNYVTCDLEKNLYETFRIMMMLGETNFLQFSQLRRGLESETARLASAHALPRHIAKLEQIVNKMSTEENLEYGSRLDQEFHLTLCESAGNRLISSLFGAMIATTNNFISTMFIKITSTQSQAEALYESHRSIVAAVKNHDESGAINAIWKHFEIVDSAIVNM